MANPMKAPPKYYKNRNADERQSELYKKFPTNSFLGNERNVDHVLRWNTFFRRNLHRLAIDYLGIPLHMYQIVILYLMGVCNFIVIIACRAAAKSFIIALYACCRCIVYPNSRIVLSSATKGQSKLIISEKIQNELMTISSVLNKEILRIKDNNNETIVYFRSGSTIVVVPASENGRGHRSNVIIREECRQIAKKVDDSILSPFQIVRQPPYLADPYYANMKELQELPVDIYISSSWIEPHWMWDIVDRQYESMLNDKGGCLLAFDESITLKHNIKKQEQLQEEKRKQDPITWKLEFENARLKENQSAFFTYQMLLQNQKVKKPFYPRRSEDIKDNKKNVYDIPKQPGEIRIVSVDMAFVENKKNDNSIFSCIRALPDYINYRRDDSDVRMSNGFRRIVPYLESVQGGDTVRQAIRIRQLFDDFHADYIVLDTRNGGIVVYDMLAREMYDDERDIYYSPLSCMNDDGIANRIKVEGANPCIFAVTASQKLNSDIAIDFRRVLNEKRIEFLINFEMAKEETLPKIKEYCNSPDANVQIFYESPFLETQAMISETVGLVYEKKQDSGVIVIHEQGENRKDRYTSVSYGSYFISTLERENIGGGDDYDYGTFIN